MTRFEQLTGKGDLAGELREPVRELQLAAVQRVPVPARPFAAIRSARRDPLLLLVLGVLPVARARAGLRLRAVAEGRFDSYITRWAAAARSWGHPFFLRFDWEMNSSDIPLVAAVQRQQPGLLRRGVAPRARHLRARRAPATRRGCGARTPTPNRIRRRSPRSTRARLRRLDMPRRLQHRDDPWRSFASIFAADYARSPSTCARASR